MILKNKIKEKVLGYFILEEKRYQVTLFLSIANQNNQGIDLGNLNLKTITSPNKNYNIYLYIKIIK